MALIFSKHIRLFNLLVIEGWKYEVSSSQLHNYDDVPIRKWSTEFLNVNGEIQTADTNKEQLLLCFIKRSYIYVYLKELA
ncbi:unnamed protein product [Schistosoma intercalatum]|nr:unnamed protein product [Schistosoma intercalatum]